MTHSFVSTPAGVAAKPFGRYTKARRLSVNTYLLAQGYFLHGGPFRSSFRLAGIAIPSLSLLVSQDILPTLPNPANNAEPIRLDASADKVSISTDKLESRKRRICASIAIPVSLEPLWQLLTDYDRLADYIPNLTVSRQVEHPKGGIRLEQIGAQCFLNIKFCARVLLDMQERFPEEIGFSMIEGDFKQFLGRWRLQPALIGDQPGTLLSYEVIVQPPLAMPARLIEHHLCHNLTENLLAIRQHAMAIA